MQEDKIHSQLKINNPKLDLSLMNTLEILELHHIQENKNIENKILEDLTEMKEKYSLRIKESVELLKQYNSKLLHFNKYEYKLL